MPITTIPDLNDKIWGIKRRDLTLVAARTSHGKSVFMNQLAWDLADQNHKVLYLSLEMDVCSLQERLFCNIFSISNSFLFRGGFKTDKDIIKRWGMFENMMEKSFLEYSDQIGRNWQEIDALIGKLTPKPDVVILDHINEISSGNVRDKRQAVDDYIIHFREMAIKNNFALIVGAQINRSGQAETNKEPRSYQLKESGKLEESADLILLLYWQYKDDDRKDKNAYKIIVDKHRNGWTGSVKAKIIPEHYRITTWEDSDEIEMQNNKKNKYKEITKNAPEVEW